ncbi:MAG: SBBP repeat-containing protein [Bacteroidota bacterium]
MMRLLQFKKTGILAGACILSLAFANSFQAQNLTWAKSLGGASNDYIEAITVDASGNVYTTGKFDGIADLDPGVSTFSLTSTGSSDIFVSKLDVNGNFVWAKQIGGSGNEFARSIKVDAIGNVYLAGSFDGTVDFNPGSGTFNLTSPSGYDVFVSKWDANGDFVWAKQMGGTGNQVAPAMTNDAAGNIYITGYFGGTADFDPGVATFTLTAIGANDIFISKLDANGDFVWAKNMGSGASASLNANCITTDASGNVCIAGYFGGTLDFDPSAATYTLIAMGGSTDMYVSKLDANGIFMWAKQIGGMGNDAPEGIAIDASGNIYTTGSYVSTSDFDPGVSTYTLTPSGGTDIFVSKLDASGNFVFAKSIGASGYEEVYDITLDASGNIYTTGYFEGTVDFDPGVGATSLVAIGTSDIFINKLDVSGDFVWAKNVGNSTVFSYGYATTSDAVGNIYTSGLYSGTTDFDPNAGIFNLTAQGNNDVFILKLNSSNVGIAESYKKTNTILYPNPASSLLTIKTDEEIQTLSIYNTLGTLVQTETEHTFSVKELSSGIYLLQIKTVRGTKTIRFIKE